MTSFRCRFLLLLLVPFLVVQLEDAAARPLPMLDNERGVLTIAPLLQSVTPGVVNISVLTQSAAPTNPLLEDPFFRRFFGVPDQLPTRQAMSAGSGVIVDAAKGYVLTNNHVIKNAAAIRVTLKDGRQFKADLVGSDPETDIALLKIDPENLTAVAFGDSDRLMVGDVVVAIGNPFGIGQTVTSGIISALGRSGLGIEGYEDFIQTDASINPGNSGGALINTKGELIGINTAIIGPSGGNVGIGFAVPSNMAKAVAAQLARYGEVRRGRLGVSIQDLTPEIGTALNLRQSSGVIVTYVEKDSPAAHSGIKAGDIIVALDGRPVRDASDLRNQVGLIPRGQDVSLELVRDGKRMTVSFKVGRAKSTELPGDKALPEFSGAVFRGLPPEESRGNDFAGVFVAKVELESPAWHYGLRKNDLIVAVNRVPTRTTDELVQAIKQAGRVIAINLIRDGNGLFIVIRR